MAVQLKTLNGYEFNASALGGVEAGKYALKTDTAPDSEKLGGKAPEYYLSPRNLMDNSDFTNPVNQRGQTNYAGSWVYGIDRWLVVTTNEQTSDNAIWIDSGQVTLYYYAELIQKIPLAQLKGKTFTFAVNNIQGTTTASVVVPENPGASTEYYATLTEEGNVTLEAFKTAGEDVVTLRIRSLHNGWRAFYWAALYEGEYTADTLPPYVPKGYAAELAECQRYYYQSWDAEETPATENGEQTSIAASIYSTMPARYFPTTMRVKPTVSIYAPITGNSGVMSKWGDGSGEYTGNPNRISKTGFSINSSSGGLISNAIYVFHFSASADI